MVRSLPTTRLSYSEAVKRLGIPDTSKQQAIAALEALRKRNWISRQDNISRSEIDTNFRLIYVQGITAMRISDLKSHLYNLQFRISQIAHFAFIARSTVEMLVMANYAEALKQRAKTCGFSVIDKYDPSKPLNPQASVELQAKIKTAFVSRVFRTIDRTSREEVRTFFSK